MMERREFRANILKAYGANASDTEELLAYNENVFDIAGLVHPVNFPLAPELHIATWEQYLAEATVLGTFEALKKRLYSCSFPSKRKSAKQKHIELLPAKGFQLMAWLKQQV